MNIYGIFKSSKKSSKILIKQWQHVECGFKIKLKKPRYTTPTTQNDFCHFNFLMTSFSIKNLKFFGSQKIGSEKNFKNFVRKFNCPVWMMFNFQIHDVAKIISRNYQKFPKKTTEQSNSSIRRWTIHPRIGRDSHHGSRRRV